MGPTDNSTSTTNKHKDDQIADLELQLAAHAARTAKLHARLMATLDTLDSERCTYADEISDECNQRVALQSQLRVAKAKRAEMEAERDSLREGVLHLIEKVEICNDYSLWPHSGLATTGLAPPTKPRHLHEQPQSSWTAPARAYSAALVTTLREECEQERRAHSASLRRITELEAQLARREAELEERYDVMPVSPVDSPLPPLSRDGAIRVLRQSAARNKALTHEIAVLVQKLEDAQVGELEQSPYPSPIMATPKPLRVSSPVSPTPQRRPSPLPRSSPKDSPLIPSALRSPRSPSPLLLPKRVAPLPSDIARQIAAVTQDLANLRAEEKRLLQASHTALQQQFEVPQVNIIAAPDERTFQHILLIEEECIRLRAELAASTAREAALREMLTPNLAPVSAPTEKDVFGEDEDDSEPMDLATPLRPTVLLDPDGL